MSVDYFPWRSDAFEVTYYLRDARDLAQALNRLPEGSKVTCNAVGNLAVVDEDNEFIGYMSIREHGEDHVDCMADPVDPGPVPIPEIPADLMKGSINLAE